MSIDFSSMTPKALQKLISDATREQKRKKNRASIGKVRAKIVRAIEREGYTLEELFGTAIAASPAAKTAQRKASKSPMAGRKVPPKYRNPDNAEEVWTGRGRSPAWFNAQIESGKTRDDLLIRD